MKCGFRIKKIWELWNWTMYYWINLLAIVHLSYEDISWHNWKDMEQINLKQKRDVSHYMTYSKMICPYLTTYISSKWLFNYKLRRNYSHRLFLDEIQTQLIFQVYSKWRKHVLQKIKITHLLLQYNTAKRIMLGWVLEDSLSRFPIKIFQHQKWLMMNHDHT